MQTINKDLSFGLQVQTVDLSFGLDVATFDFELSGTSLLNNAENFIFTVQTDNTGTSNSDQFTLPLPDVGSYNAFVIWGDGTSDTITTYNQAEITHTYSAAGSYTIQIRGTLGGFQFNNGGDKLKLTNVSQCGVLDISTNAAFHGCSNMTWTATDAPTISSNIALFRVFTGCSQFNGDISNWNTSICTSLSGCFNGCTSFDQDLSNWDISNISFATNAFGSVTLSTENYDSILTAWNAQSVQSGVSISFGNSQYTINSAADTARDSLQITNGWTITDGGAVGAITEFNTLISTGYTSGYQPVMGANKAALSTFMSALDSDGILDKLDVLYLFATSGDANFALLNLVDATAFEATANGTVTFTSNEGYKGDGSTGYLDWGWSPSDDGVNFQLNSASIFSYNTVDAGNDKVLMGTRKGSGDSNIWLYSTSGNIESAVNVTSTTGTLRPKGTSGNTTGFFAGDRSDANTVTLYEGGVQQAQVTASTSELNAGTPNMLSLALNNTIAGIGFESSGRIQVQGAGASLSATEHANLNTRINTYLTAVGAI